MSLARKTIVSSDAATAIGGVRRDGELHQLAEGLRTTSGVRRTKSRAHEHAIAYRKDIQGLRAFAILPIVLFHAGIESMVGGFVGVDLFFVISGFLITSIIYADMERGTFSLPVFYSRRVARILPALLTMLAIVTAIGALFFFPKEIAILGESGAAAATFVSNIFFWTHSNYFDIAADLQPFLHTWSVAVEEQYYIFYPPFLMILARYSRTGLGWGVAAVTLASFALALALVMAGKAESAFYLLPSRMWELGIGAVVALNFYPKFSSGWVNSLLGMIGLCGMLASFMVVRSDMGFPAPWALLPCGSAALLIAYGKDTAAAGFLSFPGFLWIGRRSYSLYLWHWPIIVLYRMAYGITLTPLATALLLALSVAAAALSYEFVERPFLQRFRDASPVPNISVGVVSALGVMAAGLALFAMSNQLWTYRPDVQRILSYDNYINTAEYRYQFRPSLCFMDGADIDRLPDPSCFKLSDTKPNMIVAGDSLAAHYWRAFALRFPDRNVIQATAPGCRTTLDPVGPSACRAVVNTVLGPLANSKKVGSVVLSGRWKIEDLPNLVRTIRFLRAKNIRVLVLGPSVEYEGLYPDLYARAVMEHDLSILDSERTTERLALSRQIEGPVRQAGAQYVPVYELECPDGKCRLTDNGGEPTNFDCCHKVFERTLELVRQFPVP